MTVITHGAVDRFINGLKPLNYAKTIESIVLLEKFGRLLAPPDSKKIRSGLFELRIQTDDRIRLLYGFIGNRAIIVHGFIKKTGKLSPRDIRLAERRLRLAL